MKVFASLSILLLAALLIYSQASFLSPGASSLHVSGGDVDKCVTWGNNAWNEDLHAMIIGTGNIVPHYNATSLVVNYTLTLQESPSSSSYFVPLAVYCPFVGKNQIIWHGKPCC